MDSLNTIQKVAKFGKIVSKIVYVLCFVSFIILLITSLGIWELPNTISISGKDIPFIEGLDDTNVTLSKATIFDQLINSAILLIGELYLAYKALKYFEFELEEGTPFTFKSAEKMKNLGILVITVPIIASLVALIAHIIIQSMLNNVTEFNSNLDISLTMGLFFLFLSAVFRYGATLALKGKDDKEEKTEKKAKRTKKVKEEKEVSEEN